MADLVKVYRHGAVARLTHFVHLVGMFMVIFSGFQILYPSAFPVFGMLGTARKIHFMGMYLVFFPIVFRWFYHAVVENDLKTVIFRPKDITYLPAFLKYYLFIDKKKPWGHEYNPGQRITYSLWPLVVLLQAFTGFAIYWPTAWVFPGVISWFGGIVMLKFWHTMIAWFFVVTLAIHMYLGSTGSSLADAYWSMVTGYENQKAH